MSEPSPPDHIKNVSRWQNDCRRIRARSMDWLEGRLTLVETARALAPFAYRAGLESDPDVAVFLTIERETGTIPINEARRLWSPEILQRKDVELTQACERYGDQAHWAARRLVERLAWTIEAKSKRRKHGGTAPSHESSHD